MKLFRSCLTIAFVPLSMAAAQTPAPTVLPGASPVSDLAVNAKDVMWAIRFDQATAPDKTVLRWNGREFEPQLRTAMRIAVDPMGNPWTVSSTGVLANLPMGATQWIVAPIKAADVSVGADGSVWAIGTDQSIHRRMGTTWSRVGGAAVRIAVDPRGNAWVVNSAGNVWRFDGATFQLVPGSARDIAIGPDGSVFIVGSRAVADGNEILQWIGDRWVPISGVGGFVVAVGQKLYVGTAGTNGRTVHATDYVRSTATFATAPTSASRTSGGATTIAIADGGSINVTPQPTAPAPAPAEGGAPLVIRGGPTVTSATAQHGTLICPILDGMRLRTGCAFVGEKALYLGKAPSVDCTNGAFRDPQNGGECWVCPAGFTRNVSPVYSNDACWKPVGETLSKATTSGSLGCKAGFFTDPRNGGECWQCPAGFNRTLDPVTAGTACSKTIFGPFSVASFGGKPRSSCAAPSFFDPINGGSCWTCPAGTRRTLNAVTSDGACAKTIDTQYSVATLKSGCATVGERVGYGAPFRDARNGGECWACPVPLVRNSAPVNSTATGIGAACGAGGNTNRIVWQSPQYPEPGAYAFMPGLLKIALSNPKAIDAFVAKRANGDANRKRAIWASMVEDPGSSAEVKALLFAALLNTAKNPAATAEAKMGLAAFERYVRARRTFVAEEAKLMYDAWQAVDGYNAYQAARSSLGGSGLKAISSDILGAAGGDYKAYAWSAAAPDSAGLEFVVAAAALTGTGASAVGSTVNSNNLLPVDDYIGLTFLALDKGMDMLGDLGKHMQTTATSFSTLASGRMVAFAANGAGLAASLVGSAIDLGMAINTIVEKDKQAAEYSSIVADASAPVSVRALLDSRDDDDRRSLLLYWSLATSPYSANAKLSAGELSSSELCSTDEWTKLQCEQAKVMVAAAAKAAGY